MTESAAVLPCSPEERRGGGGERAFPSGRPEFVPLSKRTPKRMSFIATRLKVKDLESNYGAEKLSPENEIYEINLLEQGIKQDACLDPELEDADEDVTRDQHNLFTKVTFVLLFIPLGTPG
ncbi:hypothetical protein CB1_000338016 [Camelus ferus]|nr:hypothetical protein CB1_000338016 [Camelus ferus]